MANEFVHQIGRLHRGDHACLLYETSDDQLAAMVPFFKDGLARNERCLYVADDRTVDEVKAYLSEAGIDVSSEIGAGRLDGLNKGQTYLKDGAFDPDAMIAFLGNTLDETMADGFAGLRGAGEMTWALGSEKGCEGL